MSEPQASTKRRWRWRWAFLFVFSAHAALVFWFGERVVPVQTTIRPAPLLFMAADEQAMARLDELIPAGDPTLFALPSERGFSGEAWLKFAPSDFTLSNWTATPKWLPVPADEFGSFLAQVAEISRVSTEDLLEQRKAVNPFELRTPASVLSTASTFSVEGPVSSRLTSTPSIPFARHTDLVTNTVVEIAVRTDGVVESVMLTAECGISTADEAALTLARDLTFTPVSGEKHAWTESLDRGRVVFTWHVIPPASSNATSTGMP